MNLRQDSRLFFRFWIFKFLALLALALLSTILSISLSSCFSEPINSSVVENIVLPQDAHMINVKKYGVMGDGVTDDTEAIRQLVKDNLNQHKTLFFPSGTYLVSDIIEWKLDNGKFYPFLTFQGEGIGNTIIKLKDNASGFDDPEHPKPITKTGSSGSKGGPGTAKNAAHNNYIFDMTFDTGKGNPGAIGIDFTASNTGGMENVEIISGDGQGVVGLKLVREVGPCLIKNVTVKGFDVGIRAASRLIHVTLEDINLENQNVVGIDNDQLVIAIRHLISNNSVPALRTNNNKGPVVLIDSELRGGSSQVAAIESNTNILIRNVKTQGYKTALQHNGEFISGSYVEEFVSEIPVSLFKSSQKTLNLPIEETPVFIDNNLENWANVATYGAISDDNLDDSIAIQKAINSGKTTIYFPQGKYNIEKPVVVGSEVRRIIGFNSILQYNQNKDNFRSQKDDGTVMFRFENRKHPLIFERFLIVYGGILESATSQPIVVRHTYNPVLLATSDVGTWFIEDVYAHHLNLKQNQKLYARHLNLESPPPRSLLKNEGGFAWILGYKTEYGNTVAATLMGGKTEILGGMHYPAQGFEEYPEIPLLINQNSSVSATYREISFGPTYKIHIEETRNLKTKMISRGDLDQGFVVSVPLYLGYKP